MAGRSRSARGRRGSALVGAMQARPASAGRHAASRRDGPARNRVGLR
ncbi:hypothetical protein [Lysobacter gummosus]